MGNDRPSSSSWTVSLVVVGPDRLPIGAHPMKFRPHRRRPKKATHYASMDGLIIHNTPDLNFSLEGAKSMVGPDGK